MRQTWAVCCDENDLIVNMDTGTYMGCSYSDVRKTRGRLFTTTLTMRTVPDYHCIAWSEL